jgi:putative FmdB family regulatory protein
MLYEYKCKVCGVFENLQTSHTPLKKCPVCKGLVEKLISLSSFKLVGEGWTKTEQFNDKVKLTEKQLELEDIQEDKAIARAKAKKSKELGILIADKLGAKGQKIVT